MIGVFGYDYKELLVCWIVVGNIGCYKFLICNVVRRK